MEGCDGNNAPLCEHCQYDRELLYQAIEEYENDIAVSEALAAVLRDGY
jgi:hypothetical protein